MPLRNFVALDVESTGLDPSRNEVIEVATRGFDQFELGSSYSTFVKPRASIPLEIVRLTGITDNDVSLAPPLLDLEMAIRNAIGRATIVGHNVAFDVEMLASGGIRLTNDAIDTLALARLLLPGLPSYSLGNVAASLGIEPDGAFHRAAADASLSARVMQELIRKISRIDSTSRMRIASLLDASQDPIASLFLDIEPDPSGATESVNLSPEFRFLTTLKRPETLKRTGDTSKIAVDGVRAFFTREGVLADAIEGFQHRDGQEKMAVAVAKAGNEDGHDMLGQSIIVDPNGTVIAEASSWDDELILADCDLDMCELGKRSIFDFHKHRRPEAYARIVEQTGRQPPPRWTGE